ncbi:MAG: PilN domain-containing protein [Gemmatimonadaceae bacterium]|nr:PilN domain-containing protein [Gemmatimonadaceae bacterium]
MSAPTAILLDREAAYVRVGSAVQRVVWRDDRLEQLVEEVRALVGSASGVVLVVGLGWLEIAEPELPPLDVGARRAVLWRDADRYFPIVDPVAAVSIDHFALAMPSATLHRWVRAFAELAPVRAVVTSVQLAVRSAPTTDVRLAAADGEHGIVSVRAGRLTVLRRAAEDVGAPGTFIDGSALSFVTEMLAAASRWSDAPLAELLVDASLDAQLRSRRRQRLWMSAALAMASAALLLGSIDRWRARTLAALEAESAVLSTQAQPALDAESRHRRAEAELQLLNSSRDQSMSSDAPLAVLAAITAVLPRDAVVQRLEFDGSVWRVDGTTVNAPRLVPLMDGHRAFADVRIAAASQRFLDAGRQRESFAISFRMRTAAGGARGTP